MVSGGGRDSRERWWCLKGCPTEGKRLVLLSCVHSLLRLVNFRSVPYGIHIVYPKGQALSSVVSVVILRHPSRQCPMALLDLAALLELGKVLILGVLDNLVGKLGRVARHHYLDHGFLG